MKKLLLILTVLISISVKGQIDIAYFIKKNNIDTTKLRSLGCTFKNGEIDKIKIEYRENYNDTIYIYERLSLYEHKQSTFEGFMNYSKNQLK